MYLRDSQYYQQLHTNNPLYQTNNWLLEELESIRSLGSGTLIEVGCGNGRFLSKASAFFQKIYGIDWAQSPLIDDILVAYSHIHFLCLDILTEDIPIFGDVLASADFLEHLPPYELENVIRKLDRLSTNAFHKVACYDDGHSHDSVFSSQRWLAIFKKINKRYTLAKESFRYGDESKVVAVFTKYETSLPSI